jgi:hypothetical protein
MVHGKKPDLHLIHAWGQQVFVKVKQGDKLSPRAEAAMWIGFSGQSNGHCIYWPQAHKVSVERNVLFHEESPREAIPIVPTDKYDLQRPGMSRRPSLPLGAGPSFPTVPPAPKERLLSKEREVEREIEIVPEDELEELQPGQCQDWFIKGRRCVLANEDVRTQRTPETLCERDT